MLPNRASNVDEIKEDEGGICSTPEEDNCLENFDRKFSKVETLWDTYTQIWR
jgi:hypothetical protein